MPTRLRILPPAEAPLFGHMTFPAYRSLLGERSLAVGAYVDDVPAALALAGPGPAQNRAELLSLLVGKAHRRRGLATTLLGQLEKRLAAESITAIHTTWSETIPGALPFQTVLAKRAWSAPSKRLLILRGDMNGDFGLGIRTHYARYRSPDSLPRGYTVTPWHDMTEADRTFILSREDEENWYPKRTNPFREEAAMEPGLAIVLRKEGAIAGWITVHRTTPETLRYTDVFIRQDLRRAGAVIIATLTHLFWRHMDADTPKFTWGIEANNDPLRAMCRNRLSDFSQQSWTYGAEKQLTSL